MRLLRALGFTGLTLVGLAVFVALLAWLVSEAIEVVLVLLALGFVAVVVRVWWLVLGE